MYGTIEYSMVPFSMTGYCRKLLCSRVVFFENVDSFVQQCRHQAEYTDG